MSRNNFGKLGIASATLALTAACAPALAERDQSPSQITSSIGRVEVSTIPFDPDLHVRSGTFMPSGSVLVSYAEKSGDSRRDLRLATMNDDGTDMRTFFAGEVPKRPKDNGLRSMVFEDNKRIFMGDFVLECSTSLETCNDARLLPVEYPAEIAEGDHISHRWTEIITAPDNRHISWTTLFSNYSAMVFTGELERTQDGYRIVKTRVVSTVESFRDDPEHADGVIPQTVRGGEVKQFVHGGTAISMAGAVDRDLADSTVLHLASGEVEAITDAPGYDETTIFSPDERLGLTMTSKFSPKTDLAVLGVMPRPYATALNMGITGLAYNYSVSGVRRQRSGNIGPALIEIDRSKSEDGYLGTNLNTENDWVYNSPMSWHPNGKIGMWLESRRGPRGGSGRRMQVVRLPDYRPGAPVPAAVTPDAIPYARTDLSFVPDYVRGTQETDVKVYGRESGFITYRRSPQGLTEKVYENFSDDGMQVYSGKETFKSNPRANSTYTADVTLSGPRPGRMYLKITFGPATDFFTPTQILFDTDGSGIPYSSGFAEYGGQRFEVSNLLP